MTDDLEQRLRQEGEACAREAGWPDEMYFGLLERALATGLLRHSTDRKG